MRTRVNLQSDILLPTEQTDMEINVERDYHPRGWKLG